MSDHFTNNDPFAWTEDEVLVIRAPVRLADRRGLRRESSWKSLVAMSFFGLAVGAALHFGPATSGAETEAVVRRDTMVEVKPVRAGVVPHGYWQSLSRAVAKMPELADDTDDADYEPFI